MYFWHVSKNKANITTQFPVNLSPFQMIIYLKQARYLPIQKLCKWTFFKKRSIRINIGLIMPSVQLHVNAS